jgi:hypothetical protein
MQNKSNESIEGLKKLLSEQDEICRKLLKENKRLKKAEK